MELSKFKQVMGTLDEKKLLDILKKVSHESDRFEFKQYFAVEGELWRKTTDEIAVYLAGLANAGGGILFLGIPVNQNNILDEDRWYSNKPIKEIDSDRLNQLLQHKLPDEFYNNIDLRVIPSTIHEGYCRIVILAPKHIGLVHIDF